MRARLSLVLIAAAALAIHFGAIKAPFFADDYLFLDQANGRSLPATLATHDPIGNFYRPVSRQLYFWNLIHLGQASPFIAHVWNLALFLGALVLLWAIVQSIAGEFAAGIAAAFFGLHYAADVPLLWVSGSQEILAVTLALAALALHRAGRHVAAGVALFLGCLSKETVAITPIIALMLDPKPGQSLAKTLDRARSLFTAVGVAAIVWGLALVRGMISGHSGLHLDWGSIPAAITHLVQVALGIEWSGERPTLVLPSAAALIAIPITALAVLMASSRSPRTPGFGPRRTTEPSQLPPEGAIAVGFVWALLAAVPVAAVVHIWSAYYYLFALCGVSLALGVVLARMSPKFAAVAVLVLGVASDQARSQPGFSGASAEWMFRSHINRAYLERAMAIDARFLHDIKHAQPTLRPHSTVYFAGLPEFSGWQAGDGPLIRWAYRDTTLQSNYLSGFSRSHSRRGAAYLFVADHGHLHELTREDDVRDLLVSIIQSGHLDSGREAMQYLLDRDPSDRLARTWLAWAEWDSGLREQATKRLASLGMQTDSVAIRRNPARRVAREAMAKGDTAAAYAAYRQAVTVEPFDADLHAKVADLALLRSDAPRTACLEAFAARVLEPGNPKAWRRWATAMLAIDRGDVAATALERYFALAGDEAQSDVYARRVLTELRRGAVREEVVEARVAAATP